MFAFMYMWWFWVALMLIWMMPMTYGWGYRGWGAPYPTYVQRRRMQRAVATGSGAKFDHQAWGRTGDLIWAVIFVDAILLVLVLFWY